MLTVRKIKGFLARILRYKTATQTNIWNGNYNNWEQALEDSKGYQSEGILDKITLAVTEVLEGRAAFERDSVLFYEEDYSWPLLTNLLHIANDNNGSLNVIDFGGSLGSTYLQNRKFLQNLRLTWTIVEQPHFVTAGRKLFSNHKQVSFTDEIEAIDCTGKVLLLSSVLQYLETPFEFLTRFIQKNFEYIILDKTAIIYDDDERITVQIVPSSIYESSYPAWFFNEKKILSHLVGKYDLITKLPSYEGYKINLNNTFGYYQGYVFKRKDK